MLCCMNILHAQMSFRNTVGDSSAILNAICSTNLLSLLGPRQLFVTNPKPPKSVFCFAQVKAPINFLSIGTLARFIFGVSWPIGLSEVHIILFKLNQNGAASYMLYRIYGIGQLG